MATFNLNNKSYKIWRNSKGYSCITMCENGYRTACLLHRLVWELTNGPIPPGYELHHIDHNRANWRLDNLLMLDRQRHQELHRQHGRSTSIYHKAGKDGRWISPDIRE